MKRTGSQTARALIAGTLTLLICISMFIGSTFAWFTDSVTGASNRIIAGSLSVDLLMDATGNGGYTSIADGSGDIFTIGTTANETNATLWEPGKTQIAYLAIANLGTLDLKYQVALKVYNVRNDLYEVMKYKIVPDAQAGNGGIGSWVNTFPAAEAQSVVPGAQIVSGENAGDEAAPGVRLGHGETHYFALMVHMDEDAGNSYQLGEVDFDLQVLATQVTAETDGFDDQYDYAAAYPEASQAATAAAAYSTAEQTVLTVGVLTDTGSATVTMPTASVQTVDGTPLADNENVNLRVELTDDPTNFVLTDADNNTITYEVSLETDSGVSIESTGDAFLVDLNVGVIDLQSFAHDGTPMTQVAAKEDVVADGQYYYDATDGVITFMTVSFSPFTFEYRPVGGHVDKDCKRIDPAVSFSNGTF